MQGDRTKIERDFTIEDGLYAVPENDGPTEIIYYHDGSSLVLSAYATVLDCMHYCGRWGSVEFIIRGDGRVLWQSGLIQYYEPGKPFTVNLNGIHELILIVTDGGNGNGEDWAAWLNLKLK